MWAGQGQHRPMEIIVQRVDYIYKLKLTYRYIVGALTVLIVRMACGTVPAAANPITSILIRRGLERAECGHSVGNNLRPRLA